MKCVVRLLTIVMLFCSCSSLGVNEIDGVRWKTVKLNYSDCIFASGAFDVVEFTIPSGFTKEFVSNEGFCEYRFYYKDSSVLYISNNVWFGSAVNFGNRRNISHDTYIKSQLLDTIEIGGVQTDELYWQEKIFGNFVIGYANANSYRKNIYDLIHPPPTAELPAGR